MGTTTLDPAQPVVEHQGRVLDWRPRFDPRSLQYRVAAEATKLPTTGRLWGHGAVLDQGREGACVGFGCAGEAAAEPAPVPGVTDAYARAYYHRCQQLDDWPGEAYEGTSVLAGCLTGRERGLWTGFQWAKSAEELAAGIVRPASQGGGPAIIGVEWRSGSYDTDELGVLQATGDVVGGHCLCVVGFIPLSPTPALKDQLADLGLLDGWKAINGSAFVVVNSWGLSFGQGGLALVPLDVMRGWVRAGGEFAIPVGRKVPRGDVIYPAALAAENLAGHSEAGSSTTLHLTAGELQPGDRVELTGGDVLGQDTHTVRGVQLVSAGAQHLVLVDAVAGRFRLRVSERVTVRRAVA